MALMPKTGWLVVELVAEFYVLLIQVCWDMALYCGMSSSLYLKDCIAFTYGVRSSLTMSGSAYPLTHHCIPEDWSVSNPVVRYWNLALYLMFMLILLDI